MATRDVIPGAPLVMADHAADLDDKFAALFDASNFPLTSTAGTNAVTATLTPALDGDGLQEGMTFTLVWAAANTGNVTLNINAGGAVAVNQADGTAIPAGGNVSGAVAMVRYTGSEFRLLTAIGGDASFGRSYEIITATQSWTVPDLPDDTPVRVRAWAGGGGGHAHAATGGGGGGGGYSWAVFRLGDLGSSVTCTIGAGGATSSNGGNTTFGSFLTAYGGQQGKTGSGGTGGGSVEGGWAGGFLGGGLGSSITGADPEVFGTDCTADSGGGGGGLSSDGYRATFGGGGGGGASGLGGTSKFGGAGGDAGSAGSAPSGGGGRNAAGARGQIIISI